MAYKYNSILKTFEYSKESYQIISDFLLSGDITNPDILLNVTKITAEFKPNLKPKHWFELSSAVNFVKALVKIKIQDNDKKLKLAFKKWFRSEGGNSALTQNSDFITVLEKFDNKELQRLMKVIGLISVKKGNLKGSKNGKSVQGTWIHKDLAIEYTRWLDINFSIWISQKILKLISDEVAWNEIRAITKMDYKPLILAIEKYVMPKYPNMDENIIKGQIANYINLRVMGQKAKEIRAEKQIEDDELTRDYFKKLQLKQIEEVQVFAKMLIVQLDIYDFKTLEEKLSKYKF